MSDPDNDPDNIVVLEEVVKAKETSSSEEEKEGKEVAIIAAATSKKRIPSDKEWLAKLDEKTIKIYKKHLKSQAEVADLNLKCTSCFEQINHLQSVRFFLDNTIDNTSTFVRAERRFSKLFVSAPLSLFWSFSFFFFFV